MYYAEAAKLLAATQARVLIALPRRGCCRSGEHTTACVLVIDDDPGFRESLGLPLQSASLRSRLFAEFLEAEPEDYPTCLVLDVRLPGPSGLEFQRDLITASVRLR